MSPSSGLETTIRRYYAACNAADADGISACLSTDAVHYFPDGAPQGPFRGAAAIASGWVDAVRRLDSRWTIDGIVVDSERRIAVVEWTHFKPNLGAHLRGDEWILFDEDGRISEIRAYYACPPAAGPGDHGLGGFDYAGRGYATSPPSVQRRAG